jgi:outer membrane protein assembly factor BamB
MKRWLAIALFFLFSPLPLHAAEQAHDSLPPELVRLRDEGRLTVKALWAWNLVPQSIASIALEFRALGLDLIEADRELLTQWARQADDGNLPLTSGQREALDVLLGLMNSGQAATQVQAGAGPAAEALQKSVVTEPGVPQAISTDDYAMVMYRGGPERTGVSAWTVPAVQPTLVWKLKMGEGPCRAPVVLGANAYLGSVDGHLYALDLATGTLKWKFYAEDWVDHPPAVAGDTVFFGNVMGDKSGDRHLFAVDVSTGSEKWRFKSQFYGVNSSPAIINGTVYFGAGDSNLYALDAQTGEKKWSFQGTDSVGTPAISDGTAYFAHGNRLTAVQVGSEVEKWTFRTQTNISTCPVVSDSTVYVGVSDEFHIYAVDAVSGQEKWKFSTGLISYPPAVDDGVVYAVSFDNLYALDARTGAVNWTINTARENLTAPVISEQTILVGAGKYMLALDRTTGQEKWRFEAGDQTTTPAISDGVIYFWSDDGYFYAVR